MSKKRRIGKGSYGQAELPVARAYLPRRRRRWMVGAGLAGCLGVAVWMAASFAFGGGRAASPGPLASGHANFEAACSTCHEGLRGATEARCLDCHGRVGAGPEGYRYAAHYTYRRPAGEVAHPGERVEGHEVPCTDCHREHRGRRAPLTAVPDAACIGCHPFGSFERGHPEFAFAREEIPDDPNLRFPHRHHVAEVANRLGLDDRQQSCVHCHEPDALGRGFQALSFDRHCDACHLTAAAGTPRLPVGDPAGPGPPGVVTLAALRGEWGPGLRWALFTNPEEFREAGGTVIKRPVYHRDPWILENLRRIRRALYGDLGLAELLEAAVDRGTVVAEGGELYREAIATLRERAAELRHLSGAGVQEELRRIEELLAQAIERLEGGEAIASTAPFVPGPGHDPRLDPERTAQLQALALDLTEPCRLCHVVTDGAIQRVQKDQRTLLRAEFNHRAHLVQVPSCVDCHNAIPRILDGPPKGEDDPTDVAETQNLPTLSVCRECHKASEASMSCVTCHRFHPGGSRHAGLVVYGTEASR